MILARRGDLSAAIPLGQEAVRISSTTDVLFRRGIALEDLAEVMRLAGSDPEADRLTARAIRLYDRKGVTILAQRARERLAAYGSAARSRVVTAG